VPSLQERIQGDLNSARKSQNKALTLLLGTTLAEIKNKRIELKRDPNDDEVIDVLRKGVRKRGESVELFEKAGRQELADKEKAEILALEHYLPPPVGDDEIRAAVVAALAGGAANIGAVMSSVMPVFRGRVEGGRINAIGREEIAKRA
jgi:uncharacterized protein YqeY